MTRSSARTRTSSACSPNWASGCSSPRASWPQSAEAKEKAKRYDATIGIAREKGKPMFLPSVMKYFNDITPAEALTYAPATGRADLRKKWREELIRKNPSLAAKSFSLPIVTGGVTHALSLVGDLFLDRGEMVLLPDKFWENYELLYGVRLRAQLGLFPFFNAVGRFNVEALRQALATRAGSWKTMLILNFPNNPTGYSITKSEADQIVAVLQEAADDGRNLIVVTDDAYFGLFYGADLAEESLFARLANLHDRILAVKVDGPTKEEFVWGLRTGMLTFSTRAFFSNEALYQALEKKVAGAIRSAVSNCSHASQSVLVKALSAETILAERKQKKGILEERANCVHKVLGKPEYRQVLGAVSLQRRLLHVPEAQGHRCRDVPQAPAGEVRRGRDCRRRARHSRGLLGRGGRRVGGPLCPDGRGGQGSAGGKWREGVRECVNANDRTALDCTAQVRYDNLSYQELPMATVKIAVTLDRDIVAQLDQLVEENKFPNRSRAVQEAVSDKLDRLQRSRLARECAKLDPAFEKALAEEGLAQDWKEWPEY